MHTVTAHNIKVWASGAMTRQEFSDELAAVRSEEPDNLVVLNRRDWSMRFEWALHTVLFRMGYKPERTYDCDLEWPQEWYLNVAYNTIGALCYLCLK